jgi:hypothetical protein
MSSEQLIFVGFELTREVSILIEACADRDRPYLEDPAFLETVIIDGKQYLGKRVKEGVAIDRIEDTARSVVSLLSRLNSDWSIGPENALVLAVEERPDADESQGGFKGFDYSELVD